MHASVRIPSVIYNNFYFPPVFVTIPPHFLDSHLCIKSLLCSPQGFVNTVLCDCKTPTSANLFPCDLTTHHEPCSTFGSMPWFCIFDGALASEGEHGGTVEGKRSAGFLCDVCCEITAVSPEETQTAQCESTLEACSRLPGLDSIFDFNSACCTPSPLKWFLCYITALYFFYSFHFTELQCIHINANSQVSDQ